MGAMKFFLLIELSWYNKRNLKVHSNKSRNPEQELRLNKSGQGLNKNKFQNDLWLCPSMKA